MNMPQLYGEFPQTEVVFFIAADENYFNLHAKPLINSIKSNFYQSIHVHLYNPSEVSKKYCTDHNISLSYENFDESSVKTAYEIYQVPSADWELLRRRQKMMAVGDPIEKLHKELVRTYYACARFVRLHQLLTKPTYVIMLDADSLVRKPFELPKNNYDIHIFEKKHKKHVPYTQHLASSIFYTDTDQTLKLIRDHANLIVEEFDKNTFYWFLDQETLDIAIQKYKKRPLNKMFVDFDMDPSSYIWCAKGPRKNKDLWLTEVQKYQTP